MSPSELLQVDFAISSLRTGEIHLLLCSAVTFRPALVMKCRMEILSGFLQGWLRDSLKHRQNKFPYRLPSQYAVKGWGQAWGKARVQRGSTVSVLLSGDHTCSATLPAVRAQHYREIAVPMLWHVTSTLSMEPEFWWGGSFIISQCEML